MKVADYIVDYLIRQQVTDAFGIPGGVVLDLLYAIDARKDKLTPHLSYHEQAAGFAACGYAQVSGKLGVAYATKGPGFTNLLTAMADAYYDSLPVLFITAHSAATLPQGCRLVADQDMDTCGMVAHITKYAKRVDTADEVSDALQDACRIAQESRKGPVFLDIASSLFKKEMKEGNFAPHSATTVDAMALAEDIVREIGKAQRPVILIGDGINQTQTGDALNAFIEKAGVPVISSRYCHNVVGDSDLYFGYVGSHGIRYANFILSKADLVVALGNRLYFPSSSLSYGKVVSQAKFLRFDIDEGELKKHEQMAPGHAIDLKDLMPALANTSIEPKMHPHWLQTCRTLRDKLNKEDMDVVGFNLSQILVKIPASYTLVSDVGNNEFWVSRACVYTSTKNRTLYSKSFGALGNALGKAIGAYYATRQPVVAFVGDQGMQMNIQELQFIAQHRLPILIVLLNNHSSGMIKDREKASGFDYSLHTTMDSGYGAPDFAQLSAAYQINYLKYHEGLDLTQITVPSFIEMEIPESVSLTPSLPRGRDCQDLEPRIDSVLYKELNAL